jgi:hypothetical protein
LHFGAVPVCRPDKPLLAELGRCLLLSVLPLLLNFLQFLSRLTDTYWLRLILLLFFSISEIEIINIVAYGWE